MSDLVKNHIVGFPTRRLSYLPTTSKVVFSVLGNLSGDQHLAYWNLQDFTLTILKACCQTELAPDVDWRVEMTPVDFAAAFIVKMARKSSLSIGKTFHVINDKPLKSR